MGAKTKHKANAAQGYAPEIMQAAPNYMPRLSCIPGPRRLGVCQNCERTEAAHGVVLTYWREHDERDLPLDMLVCLCQECSTDLIDPHPRLYAPLAQRQPYPGVMEICADCRHRGGLDCRHPDRKENGGAGLSITFPRPDVYHLNFGGGRGGSYLRFPVGKQECAGHFSRNKEPDMQANEQPITPSSGVKPCRA